jgi:hypothetical protein
LRYSGVREAERKRKKASRWYKLAESPPETTSGLVLGAPIPRVKHNGWGKWN